MLLRTILVSDISQKTYLLGWVKCVMMLNLQKRDFVFVKVLVRLSIKLIPQKFNALDKSSFMNSLG